MRIDLRSDTVTKPSEGMLNAMFSAEVGDDVFDEDPTINALQERVSTYFGHDSGLLCPSGTMTNQVAIRVHTRPGDEVICTDLAHVYLYEGGGIARNSSASVRLIRGDRGRLNANDILTSINPDDSHVPRTSLVCLEDSVNKGGGCFYDLEEIRNIRQACDENGLWLHLDGARVFNALTATGYDPAEYGKLFHSISICFSKGLGCPVGSVLVGSNDFIKEAHRVRKGFGGGMRQAGYLASACNYALDHNVARMSEDHRRAKALGVALSKAQFVDAITPVETNIVIFEVKTGLKAQDVVEALGEHDVHCVPFGPTKVRFVTHLDFNDAQLEKACEVIEFLVL